MNISKHFLHLPDVNLCFHQYFKPNEPDRTLVLLHGAGVAGQLTWHHVCRLSKGYRRMIVPDLRGAGETVHPTHMEKAFTIADVRADLLKLIYHLQLDHFDIAGYSFGGACAMDLNVAGKVNIDRMILLEPALLERANFYQTMKIREQYSAATQLMRKPDNERTGVDQFVQLVMATAGKNQKTRETMYQRLSHRVQGLANELDALTAYMKQCDRENLYPEQQVILINGASSRTEMLHFHAMLAAGKGWQLVSIAGTDHSLIFQKPRKIAEVISIVKE